MYCLDGDVDVNVYLPGWHVTNSRNRREVQLALRALTTHFGALAILVCPSEFIRETSASSQQYSHCSYLVSRRVHTDSKAWLKRITSRWPPASAAMRVQMSLETCQLQLHRHYAHRPVLAQRSSLLPACRLRLSRRSRSAAICSASADTKDVPTWTDIEHGAGADVLEGFVVRPGQAPGTAPHPVIPTQRVTESPNNKPVILYRDTNSWCPSCERVRTLLASREQHDKWSA